MAQTESVLPFLTSVQGNVSLRGRKDPKGSVLLGAGAHFCPDSDRDPRSPAQTSQAPPRSPLDRSASPLGSVLGPFSPISARNLLGPFQENPPPLITDQIPHAHLSRQSNPTPLPDVSSWKCPSTDAHLPHFSLCSELSPASVPHCRTPLR